MRLFFLLYVSCIVAPLHAQQPASDSLVVEVAGNVAVLHGLSGMPRDTVTPLFHDSVGHPYSGVRLLNLLQHSGMPAGHLRGRALAQYILIEAKDGYRVVFGVADLDQEMTLHRILLVDSLDGHPLPANEGPWRLIVSGDAHGARSVRMVTRIVVRDP